MPDLPIQKPSMVIPRRLDHEPPGVTEKLGWRYHHMGIPTDVPRDGERYLAQFKLYVSGFDTSPYGIEWMRFEPDSPITGPIRTLPHIAFQVEDLDAALEGKEIVFPPGSPSGGVRAAMIVHDGALVELIEFQKLPLASEACAPASSRVGYVTQPTPLPNSTAAPAAREAQVTSVEIRTLVSSPTQITAIVRGNLPDACTTLGEVKQQDESNGFRFTLYTISPTDRGCAQIVASLRNSNPGGHGDGPCTYQATFIADVTVPDNTVSASGTYRSEWKLAGSGLLVGVGSRGASLSVQIVVR